MFVWLVFAWSSWVLLVPARLQGAVVHPRLNLIALGIAALVVVTVSMRPAEDPTRLPPGNKDFALIRETTERVISAVGGEKDVLVVHVGDPAQTFETAIIYALRRHGVTPAVRRKYLITELGNRYSPDSRLYRTVVTVGERMGPVTPAGQVLIRRPEVTARSPPRAKIGPAHPRYGRSLKRMWASSLAAARMSKGGRWWRGTAGSSRTREPSSTRTYVRIEVKKDPPVDFTATRCRPRITGPGLDPKGGLDAYARPDRLRLGRRTAGMKRCGVQLSDA